jgi:hypothetical protein
MSDRHPSVQGILRWLEPNPNLPDLQLLIAQHCEFLAGSILAAIPEDNAELSAGFRKLLEAKDCFVRASLVQ